MIFSFILDRYDKHYLAFLTDFDVILINKGKCYSSSGLNGGLCTFRWSFLLNCCCICIYIYIYEAAMETFRWHFILVCVTLWNRLLLSRKIIGRWKIDFAGCQKHCYLIIINNNLVKAITQLQNAILILSMLLRRVALTQCKNLTIYSLEENLVPI